MAFSIGNALSNPSGSLTDYGVVGGGFNPTPLVPSYPAANPLVNSDDPVLKWAGYIGTFSSILDPFIFTGQEMSELELKKLEEQRKLEEARQKGQTITAEPVSPYPEWLVPLLVVAVAGMAAWLILKKE